MLVLSRQKMLYIGKEDVTLTRYKDGTPPPGRTRDASTKNVPRFLLVESYGPSGRSIPTSGTVQSGSIRLHITLPETRSVAFAMKLGPDEEFFAMLWMDSSNELIQLCPMRLLASATRHRRCSLSP